MTTDTNLSKSMQFKSECGGTHNLALEAEANNFHKLQVSRLTAKPCLIFFDRLDRIDR